MAGLFSIVLHSHLPFCLGKGKWPFGEEWLFEITLDTYLPLLKAFLELKEEKIDFKVQFGITPVLMEQLKSVYFQDEFLKYLDSKETLLLKDQESFQGKPEYFNLANLYLDELLYYKKLFLQINGDLVKAFSQLQKEGYLEILTSAATHGYLPLFNNNLSIISQIMTGCEVYEKHTGQKPIGFWLPECSYKPGLEKIISELGLNYFIADSHALTEEGTALTTRLYGIHKYKEPSKYSTYYSYDIGSNLTTFLRNPSTSELVWSRDLGYPGDGAYREFHKKYEISGFPYWKITAKDTPLDKKELYSIEDARDKTKSHASHFVSMLRSLNSNFKRVNKSDGIILSAFDTELFGHWWNEGVEWLKEVLKIVSKEPGMAMAHPSEMIKNSFNIKAGNLKESSWGMGGFHYTWYNSETMWIWDMIHEDEKELENILPSLQGLEGELLIREFLLETSSDWPFLITTSQAKEYGKKRFMEHRNKFRNILLNIKSGSVVPDINKLDKDDFIFKNINLEGLKNYYART
ncbi:MAG: 1,4-alpha-glucan branching enzyme [candidate division WS2 bacterium]|nr:1,4-alpha-glucan branching enzyme [Candidatus Lithacetigena glycinireducens]